MTALDTIAAKCYHMMMLFNIKYKDMEIQSRFNAAFCDGDLYVHLTPMQILDTKQESFKHSPGAGWEIVGPKPRSRSKYITLLSRIGSRKFNFNL